MQPTNPITEISLPVLSALFVIGACLLLYFGKIDFTGATLMFVTAAGLVGFNQAFKVASPAQQTQLATLTSQVLTVLPAVVSAITPLSPIGQIPLSEVRLQPGQAVEVTPQFAPQAQPFEPPIVPKG